MINHALFSMPGAFDRGVLEQAGKDFVIQVRQAGARNTNPPGA
jgi:hypothetical protein